MEQELIEFEVRVGPELHMQLAQIAAHRGVDINDMVNEALSHALYPALRSRNQREGRYVGKHKGRHRRAGAPWLI